MTAEPYDRPFIPAAEKRGGDHRHGDDGEAGRLRHPRQHHARGRCGETAAHRAHRPQMVLLGADVRCVPDARLHRQRASPAFWSRAGARRRTQRHSASCGSRTSSATAPMRRRRSSITAPGPSASARKAAASRTIIEMVQLDAARLHHRLGARRCAQRCAQASWHARTAAPSRRS